MRYYILLFLAFWAASCELPMLSQIRAPQGASSVTLPPPPPPAAALTGFSFRRADNPNQAADFVGTIVDSGAAGQVQVVVPAQVYLPHLVPTFAANGPVAVGGQRQTSGTSPQDFTQPVSYVVQGPSGTSRTYQVTVTQGAQSDVVMVGFGQNAGTIGVDRTTGAMTALGQSHSSNGLWKRAAADPLGARWFLPGSLLVQGRFATATGAQVDLGTPFNMPSGDALEPQFSPDGRFALGWAGTNLWLWSVAQGSTPTAHLDLGTHQYVVRFGPVAGTIYVLDTTARTVRIVTYTDQGLLAEATTVAQVPGVVSPRSMAIAPDGGAVYVLGSDFNIYGWVVSGDARTTLSSSPSLAAVALPSASLICGAGAGWFTVADDDALQISPDGRWALVLASATDGLKLFRAVTTFSILAGTRTMVASNEGLSVIGGLYAPRFSPDGGQVLVAVQSTAGQFFGRTYDRGTDGGLTLRAETPGHPTASSGPPQVDPLGTAFYQIYAGPPAGDFCPYYVERRSTQTGALLGTFTLDNVGISGLGPGQVSGWLFSIGPVF